MRCGSPPPQPDRQGIALVEAPVAARRWVQPHHPVVVGVLAGEVRGPRGAAHRIGHVRVIEADASRGRADDESAACRQAPGRSGRPSSQRPGLAARRHWRLAHEARSEDGNCREQWASEGSNRHGPRCSARSTPRPDDHGTAHRTPRGARFSPPRWRRTQSLRSEMNPPAKARSTRRARFSFCGRCSTPNFSNSARRCFFTASTLRKSSPAI